MFLIPTTYESAELPYAVVSAVAIVSGKSTAVRVLEMFLLDPPVSSIAKSVFYHVQMLALVLLRTLKKQP